MLCVGSPPRAGPSLAGHNTGPILEIMRQICGREEGSGVLRDGELRDLRLGLNVMARALRLTERVAG